MDPKFIKKLKNDIKKSEDIIAKLSKQRDEINEKIKAEQSKKRNAESTLSSFEKLMEQARKIEDGYATPKAEKETKEKETIQTDNQDEVIEDIEENEDVEDTENYEENESEYEEQDTESYENNEQEHQDYEQHEDNNRHGFGRNFF